MPPADVEEVVADAEDCDGLEREYRGEEGRELWVGPWSAAGRPSAVGYECWWRAHLAVRELVQEAALVDVLGVQDDVPVAAAAGGSNDVLVEGEGGEDDDGEQVDDGADGTGALWNLPPVGLGHVDALEPGLDEGGPQPADHGIGGGVGHAAEGERRDQGLALAAEGVGQDGAARRGQGGEADRLGAGELRCRRHGCGVRELRFDGRPTGQGGGEAQPRKQLAC